MVKNAGYLIIIEPTKSGFSAYCPELPGCITVGKTVEDTTKNMHEAIELYMEELEASGQKKPAQNKHNHGLSDIGSLQPGAYLTSILAHQI